MFLIKASKKMLLMFKKNVGLYNLENSSIFYFVCVFHLRTWVFEVKWKLSGLEHALLKKIREREKIGKVKLLICSQQYNCTH